MILNRLSKAIRKQDWFTVFLEFVIVAVGILAGLQANEWAQERQDRKQELASLERLFLESKNAHQVLNDYVQGTQRLNQLRRNAVQFVDSNSPVPENPLPLKIGINTLGRFPAVNPVTIAYDELKSSGQMQLIRSAALRDQIAQFHSGLDELNGLLRSFADNNDRFFIVYQRHVIWNYNPDSSTSDILLSTFDWDSLRADEEFIFIVIGLLRNQLVAEEGLLFLREQALSLCKTLGERVGQTCDEPPSES